MGVGDSLEAAFQLAGPIRAGSWHLIGDGIILQSVDMRFDVVWRIAAGDTTLASFTNHFDLPTGEAQFNAVPFEADAPGIAAAAHAGDQLVLRFTASGSGNGTVYIPNGDGSKTMGRIPSVKLP